MSRVSDRDIARWRFHNLHLTSPASSPRDVVSDLLAVQAENHSQATWALATRTKETTAKEIAHLYDDGEILRTHVLRPTWHFVRPDDIGWLLEVTRPRVEKTYVYQLRELEIGRDEIDTATGVIVDAIRQDGPLVRDQLRQYLEDAALPSSGRHLMLYMATAEMEGLICSGPLVDGTHSYALLQDRAPDTRRLDRDEALAELALRYFTSHGPATEKDLAYWATQTITDVRSGLKAVSDQLESFQHEGKTYWHKGPRPETNPPEAGYLLQILDECYRGVQDSRWVIDAEEIVPRTARTPTGMALVGTQIVATMRRTLLTGDVRFELEPYRGLTAAEIGLLEAAATDYGEFLELAPTLSLEG